MKCVHIMKRITKDKSAKAERVLRNSKPVKVEIKQEQCETKLDLTKFKFSGKPKIKIEIKTEDNDDLVGVGESSQTKRKHITVEENDSKKSINVSSPKVVKIKNESPKDWEEMFNNIRQMRQNFDAPVDEMGCDKCHDETASPEVIRFQSLLALMLSSQTKDQVTHSAMLKLRQHGCTIDNILSTTDEILCQLIYPVSFYKTKAKHIKKTAEILKKSYSSDIPNTPELLCQLPGVGPKMAHLCMKSAWNIVTGIGVDTHVHRISNRLGWVDTKTPEKTRKELQEWLPQEMWSEVGLILVGFGQQTCKPLNPACSNCLNKNICPFGIRQVSSSKVKK